MKKLLALAAAAIMMTGSVFAKEVLHNLDFAYQYDGQTWDLWDSDTDMNFSSFNFDYSKMTVNEGGFSFIFGANAGYTSVSPEDSDFDMGGLDLGLKLGWGGTPVNTDKVLLSLHGFFGFDFKYAGATKSFDHNDSSYSYDIDYDAVYFGLKVGADAVCAVRFNDKIGMNAGLDIYTNLGVGSLGYYSDYTDDSDVSAVLGGIGVVPKIGLTIFR